mgnify:CR=1 FL=1
MKMKQEQSTASILKKQINDNWHFVRGTENAIERKLSLWLSPSNANEIMDQIKSLEIMTLELGVNYEKCGCSDKIKQRIWRQMERE